MTVVYGAWRVEVIEGVHARGLFLVHMFRIEHALADHGYVALVQPAEEAAFVAFMAGGAADLVDLEQDGVGVAVDVDLLDDLHIAALFTLAPELAAAAAEIDGPAGALRLCEGLAVHP